MAETQLFIGLISGTSMDGVDCALVRVGEASVELLDTHSEPLPPDLRRRLLALCDNSDLSWEAIGGSDVETGRLFARAAATLLRKSGYPPEQITAIGSHGQTVFHQPSGPLPFTQQLGDPSTIAFHTGITTVADFRRKDMAAGGQGAPLAPLLHRFYFQSEHSRRAVVNLGGIANVSIMAPDRPFVAFDTGPASVLMDYWIEHHRGEAYDAGGAWAASGSVREDLLKTLMDEPYLGLPFPKSTGRELFNHKWLKAKLQAFGDGLPPEDVQATLLEYTAVTVAEAILRELQPDEVFLCGGGAHNAVLLGRLQALMPRATVDTTAAIRLDPDWVEAVAFAWLASQAVAGRPVDARTITGAHRPCILGGIYQAE